MDGEKEIVRHDGEKTMGTNNIAEINGLILGLEELKRRNLKGIRVLMDSQLVVECVNGRWKVKKDHLKPLVVKARTLLLEIFF